MCLPSLRMHARPCTGAPVRVLVKAFVTPTTLLSVWLLCRDIVSGCDHGHVHVLNFAPDMLGVPSMKVGIHE